VSIHSGAKMGEPSARTLLTRAVSRSVRNSAVAPPRSSTQRTMARRVVRRVRSVAKRMATIRLKPRTATKACSAAVPSPSGQMPHAAQSPWVWIPGPVSKRTSGSAISLGRMSTTRRRRLE
jgi:hypothetical protein